MDVKFINPKLWLLLLFTVVLPSLSYKTSAAGDEWLDEQTEDPWKVYERCQSGCDRKESSSLQDQCRRTCKLQYDEMKKHSHGGDCGCGQRECSRRGDCSCGHPECRCGGGGADCGCGQRECSRRGDCSCGHPECRCGGGGAETENRKRPAEERLKECRSRCVKEEEGQRRDRCERKCQRKFEKQKKKEGGGENNPYFFESEWSGPNSESGEGRARVVERFGEYSEELRGIEEEILKRRDESYFVVGPAGRQEEERGKRRGGASILEFDGF